VHLYDLIDDSRAERTHSSDSDKTKVRGSNRGLKEDVQRCFRHYHEEKEGLLLKMTFLVKSQDARLE
jgi:hypothetical protein